jgi:hypothetical protein
VVATGERPLPDPIPHDGLGLSFPGIAELPEFTSLLRMIRDADLKRELLANLWLPDLFRIAAGSEEQARGVLREWAESKDERKVIGAARLLGGLKHGIVFTAHPFVADLLDAAAAISSSAERRVSSELFGIAVSGTHSSVPGEPAPRHLQDRDKARMLQALYSSRPRVQAFYESLARHAESEIRRDALEWEEEGVIE